MYTSLVHGEITFDYVNNSVVRVLQAFMRNSDALDHHITNKVGFHSLFSLPLADINNVSIVFYNEPGEYDHVLESLKIMISFMRSIYITGISINIIHSGYAYDDITHYKYVNEQIVSSRGRIVFDDYR